jgi:PAS domain S-box-containing protein
LESLVFILVYILLTFLLVPGSTAAAYVEDIAILTASATAVLLILFTLPQMPDSSRRAWLALGLSQLIWLIGAFLRHFFQPLVAGETTIASVADILNLFGYLVAGYALLQYPFRSQHAPTRFRFILDAIISSGVVVTLGFLVLVRPLAVGFPVGAASLGIVIYPIADCILLILLANFSLANWMPRSAARFLGAAWTAFLISDYVYSSLTLIGSYRAGSLISLGWVCGSLLIGLAAIFEKEFLRGAPEATQTTIVPDLGVRFQRVLPIALVLVLLWYVLSDWRLRGVFSPYGLWMSVLLVVMLIVRLGIRAGEAELDRYWQLFKNLADPSFICDADGNIVLGNPACANLAGLQDQSELSGHSLFDMFGGISRGAIRDAVGREHTLDAVLRRDGAPFSLSLSPIITEARPALIAGVAHDLSEQKRQRDAIQRAYNELQTVHKKLEDLNAQLEQKVEERTSTLQQAYQQLEEQNRILQGLDQIKSDFVSLVSHELRAPLTNLSGGLELLLSRQRDSSEQRTLLLIQAEIRRLTRFVENILNISAMEAGRLVLHQLKLSLPVIVAEVREGWSNLPEMERIRVNVSEDLPLVKADENTVRSVLTHLIDNALKYAPESKVQVDGALQDGKVCVAVRDFGPGIPVEKQGLLFERFQRLEARDSQSVYGYGLGLYLSRRLLRAMDSDLLFEAPIDGGARFYFYLGLAQ